MDRKRTVGSAPRRRLQDRRSVMDHRRNVALGPHFGRIEGRQSERCFSEQGSRRQVDGRSDVRGLLRRCSDRRPKQWLFGALWSLRSQRCTWVRLSASRSKRRKAAVLRECAHRLGDRPVRTASARATVGRYGRRIEASSDATPPAAATKPAKSAALAGAGGACRRNQVATPRDRSQATRGLAAMPAPFCFWGKFLGGWAFGAGHVVGTSRGALPPAHIGAT